MSVVWQFLKVRLWKCDLIQYGLLCKRVSYMFWCDWETGQVDWCHSAVAKVVRIVQRPKIIFLAIVIYNVILFPYDKRVMKVTSLKCDLWCMTTFFILWQLDMYFSNYVCLIRLLIVHINRKYGHFTLFNHNRFCKPRRFLLSVWYWLKNC